jgi:hypothetical protein
LLAVVLPACGAKVVVDGVAAAGATGTASAGAGGGTGTGGGSTGSTPNGSGSGGTMSTGSGSSGGTGSGGGSVIPLAYTLTEYVSSPQALWKGLVHTSAIDSAGRLFVSDGQVVYVIKDGLPSIYLTYAELKIAANDDLPSVVSLDVGPDDRLYILDGSFPYNILVSQGPHDVALHLTVDADNLDWPPSIGVESPNRILLVNGTGGLYEITPASTKLVYKQATFQGGTTCAYQDFAVSQDGDFYYLPGCNGSPLLGGKTDGSGIAFIQAVNDLEGTYFWGFGGVARHPKGGAVANLAEAAYYFDKSGAPTKLSMTPSMDTIKSTGMDVSLFRGRPIEVGSAGEIYLIGADRIYRATPL